MKDNKQAKSHKGDKKYVHKTGSRTGGSSFVRGGSGSGSGFVAVGGKSSKGSYDGGATTTTHTAGFAGKLIEYVGGGGYAAEYEYGAAAVTYSETNTEYTDLYNSSTNAHGQGQVQTTFYGGGGRRKTLDVVGTSDESQEEEEDKENSRTSLRGGV